MFFKISQRSPSCAAERTAPAWDHALLRPFVLKEARRFSETTIPAVPPSSANAGSLEFTLVSDADGFESLKSEWDDLLAAAGRPHNAFQQHNWLWHWQQHFLTARRGRMAIVVGRRGGKAVLILPLVAQRTLGCRSLHFMGAPVNQYNDALVLPGGCEIGDLLEAVGYAGRRTGSALLFASRVRSDAALAPMMAAAGARQLTQEEAPSVTLSRIASASDLEAGFSSSIRKSRRRRRKQLDRLGERRLVTFREGSDAAAAVVEAIRHKRDWFEKHAVLARAYAEPAFDAFWHSVAASQNRPSGMCVSVMEAGGRPVAYEVGVRFMGTHCAHIGAFDIDYEACSPGQTQLDMTIDDCIADGMLHYDLLAPTSAYKERVAHHSVEVGDFVLPLSAIGRIYDGLNLTQSDGLAKAVAKRMPAHLRRSILALLALRMPASGSPKS